MMRHLAAVGETYAQTALDDTAWSLWPMNPSQAGTSGSPIPPSSARFPGSAGGLQTRATTRAANDNLASILAMAETVREVLPHIPDEIIIQVCRAFIFPYIFASLLLIGCRDDLNCLVEVRFVFFILLHHLFSLALCISGSIFSENICY